MIEPRSPALLTDSLPADLAVASYVKVLGTIPTSVHVFASNRSAYLSEVDGNVIVASISLILFK